MAVFFFPHLRVRNPHLRGSESRVSEEISKNPHLRRVIFWESEGILRHFTFQMIVLEGFFNETECLEVKNFRLRR